ncbi:MAG TPA: hypothetical protein VN956_20340 [Pyrinomonadaceae bacterium]|nr:hypothetical protein [Pyrinomonadaceae bacterium]
MNKKRESINERVLAVEKSVGSLAAFIFRKYHPNWDRPDIVSELLSDTTATVVRKIEEGVEIKTLSAYYLTTFENIIRNFSRKKNENLESIDDRSVSCLSDNQAASDEIETRILVREIIKLMDTEIRFIFELLLQGYNYEEIHERFKEAFSKNYSPSTLRQKFRREVMSLAKRLVDTK